MADYLTRAMRLQLTTAMENLVRSAVMEISQIFEENLHDHQVELARKGEEIAHLKLKLQRVELKLSECQNSTQIFQTARPSEEHPFEMSIAPEIDFEVPDDWCVPLDSENIKQENPCPSVRLKQFSIPLLPIPIKHEAFQKLEAARLERLRNMPKIDLQEKTEQKVRRKRGRPRKHPLENDSFKQASLNIKQEPIDIKVESTVKRKYLSRNTQKLDKFETTRQKYQCAFCPKSFDKPFGLSVHDRAHRKCKGCKKIFPSPSVLHQHKIQCKLYKRVMKLSVSVPVEETSVHIQQIKGKTLVKRRTHAQLYRCTKCMRSYDSKILLLKHSCNFVCKKCSKRFTSQMSLKIHKTKMHCRKICEDSLKFSWTQPLDEDSQECNLDSKNKLKKCRKGYQCMLCRKVFTSRVNALEHYNSHTGVKPLSCDMCSAVFSRRQSLSVHRHRTHGITLRKYITCACSKRFVKKLAYKNHLVNCPFSLKKRKKT